MSRDRRWWHVDPAGLLVAAVVAVLALGPGLLPRDGVTQGVVSGVVAALGYGLGAAVSGLARLGGVRPRRRFGAWLPVAVLGVLVAAFTVAAGGQQRAAALIGAPPPSTAAFLLGVPVTVAVVALLVAAARGLRRLTHLLRRRLPGPAAVGVLALATLVVAGVATSVALTVTEAAFRARNDEPGVSGGPPERATRSGSPTSLVGWDTLGRDGRRFVAGGRPAEQLAAAAGRAPRDPVRVYVGLESAPDPSARAALAVAELDRAGAFDRSVLALVTPTGSGSVDPPIPDALELVRGGDTAVAAVQYSTLPSDLSFLVDGPEARASTAALLDAVRARLAQSPPDRRPRLLVFGQSLGSLGSQAAFASLDDARARADGVLWVGPPHGSEPWTGLVARRDPGSPEVLPVVDGGRAVRFAGRAADLAGGPSRESWESWESWEQPRVLYLQHPSDPVVWWSPGLLWRRPDRFSEPAGSDVPPGQQWYPVITFWQTTVDLARAQSLTPDHGHRYDTLLVDGWAAVAPPPGWTAADTDRARQVFGG